MKAAIFCTSNDTSEFARRHITDDVKYINLLSPIRPEWNFDCFAVWQNEFPQDIAQYDGFILTGSPASVHDNEPWITKLLDVIRAIHAQGIPMFGGCFGHQAIAVAFGGTVGKNLKGGWSLGQEVSSFDRDAPFGLAGQAISLYSIHKEEVLDLPKGASAIASNEYCSYPAFVIGDTILTSQYHPEMTTDFLTELTDEMRGALPDAELDAAKVAFQMPHQGQDLAKAIVALFEEAKQT